MSSEYRELGCVITPTTSVSLRIKRWFRDTRLYWLLLRLSYWWNTTIFVRGNNMERLPRDSNPFHHDAMRMGTPLVRGWMAMHDGFDRPETPLPLKKLILINTRTGRRFSIDLPQD